MKCSNCGHKNDEDSLFCEECGERLELATTEEVEETVPQDVIYCPNCGAKNETDNLFCEECGTKLEDDDSDEKVEEQSKDNSKKKDHKSKDKKKVKEDKDKLDKKEHKEEKQEKDATKENNDNNKENKIDDVKTDESNENVTPVVVKPKSKKSNKSLIVLFVILIIACLGGVCFYFKDDIFPSNSTSNSSWGEKYYLYLKDIKEEDNLAGAYLDGVTDGEISFYEVSALDNPVMTITYTENDKSYTNIYYINNDNVNVIKYEASEIDLLKKIDSEEYSYYLKNSSNDTDYYEKIDSVLEENLEDSKLASENATCDKDKFTILTGEEFIDLLDSDEKFIVFTDKSSDSYCSKYMPFINKSLEEYDYILYYLDIDTLTDEEKESILEIDESFENMLEYAIGFTYISHGIMSHGTYGFYQKYSALEELLIDAGMEKKVDDEEKIYEYTSDEGFAEIFELIKVCEEIDFNINDDLDKIKETIDTLEKDYQTIDEIVNSINDNEKESEEKIGITEENYQTELKSHMEYLVYAYHGVYWGWSNLYTYDYDVAKSGSELSDALGCSEEPYYGAWLVEGITSVDDIKEKLKKYISEDKISEFSFDEFIDYEDKVYVCDPSMGIGAIEVKIDKSKFTSDDDKIIVELPVYVYSSGDVDYTDYREEIFTITFELDEKQENYLITDWKVDD